jgi:phosphoglycolate phosphatase-like HAD superfamily hydrolase
MLKALIIDCDGPIFDGRAAARSAFEATVEQFSSLGRPTLRVSDLPLLRPEQLVALAYADFPVTAIEFSHILDVYRTQLLGAEAALDLQPDIRNILVALKATGLRLALWTARSHANVQRLADEHDLVYLFDVIAGAGSYLGPKWSPASLLYVLDQLGLEPKEVAVLGDTDQDYDAASQLDLQYYHAGWSTEPSNKGTRPQSRIILRPQHLVDILTSPDLATSHPGDIPEDLLGAVARGDLVYFAGAGISTPSGLGGWLSCYLPILEALGVGWMSERAELPSILQLACSTTIEESRLFDAFQKVFAGQERPSPYHFAMLRTNHHRIWTSNYDQLFESAIKLAGLTEIRVAYNDDDLLKFFRSGRLVVKVNGDFESADFKDNLEWGVVATQDQFDKADIHRREVWRLFEDDFRNRSIAFVGVSFSDPTLRRILSIAASRVPRTKYRHFFLVRRPTDLIERAFQGRMARNLERYNIHTLAFSSYDDVGTLVSKIAMLSRRPIVGVSGNTNTRDEDSDATLSNGLILDNGLITGDTVRQVSAAIGRSLASRGFRVTSGCAPYVGMEAVTSAFSVNSQLARCYLRRAGGRSYRRTAPAIVVSGGSYDDMRRRFIGEISLLIAIGGYSPDPRVSGVEAEIRLALKRGAPVLLIPQAGGDTARISPELMANIATYYPDARLTAAIGKANALLASVKPDDLVGFIRMELADIVESVISVLMEASMSSEAAGVQLSEPW